MMSEWQKFSLDLEDGDYWIIYEDDNIKNSHLGIYLGNIKFYDVDELVVSEVSEGPYEIYDYLNQAWVGSMDTQWLPCWIKKFVPETIPQFIIDELNPRPISSEPRMAADITVDSPGKKS